MDHMDLLGLDVERFRAFATKLDGAFNRGGAAFYFDEASGTLSIDLFDRERSMFEEDEWEIAVATANALDSLLVFAFEGAPQNVVTAWGSTHVAEKGDQAEALVEVLRAELRFAKDEWERHRSMTGLTLGDAVVSPTIDPRTGIVSSVLSISAFRGTGIRQRPVAGSRQFLDVSLSEVELRRLVHKLQAALDVMEFLDAEVDDAQ
jgi:hypothetical protein